MHTCYGYLKDSVQFAAKMGYSRTTLQFYATGKDSISKQKPHGRWKARPLLSSPVYETVICDIISVGRRSRWENDAFRRV